MSSYFSSTNTQTGSDAWVKLHPDAIFHSVWLWFFIPFPCMCVCVCYFVPLTCLAFHMDILDACHISSAFSFWFRNGWINHSTSTRGGCCCGRSSSEAEWIAGALCRIPSGGAELRCQSVPNRASLPNSQHLFTCFTDLPTGGAGTLRLTGLRSFIDDFHVCRGGRIIYWLWFFIHHKSTGWRLACGGGGGTWMLFSFTVPTGREFGDSFTHL